MRRCWLAAAVVVGVPDSCFSTHRRLVCQFVLVIATSVQVVLLAVTFEGGDPEKKMTLRPTHVEYPTDGVGMIQVRARRTRTLVGWGSSALTIDPCAAQIVGSTQGRIFLGGTDGCVYELVYHEERGVLQYLLSYPPKTRKINLTASRFG